jgi:D-alanine-D-alanine ligase
MNKLKITVLFSEERTGHEATHDEVVDQVANALTEGGHKISLLGIHSSLRELLDKLDEQKPDLVFNLCESFAGNDFAEMYVTGVLSMLKLRFTGSSAAGMAYRQDKAVTKKLLAFHNVPCPNYAIYAKENLEFAGKMRFPLFVKALRHDASAGIDDSSLVNDYSSMMKQIDHIHKELMDTALVEEYIEGREFYVGILDNYPNEIVLPLVELDFSKLSPKHPHIYSEAAKFDEKSEAYNQINFGVATDLTPELRSSIEMIGKKAAGALQLFDYARIDIRLSKDGTPYVIEVNDNPYLERTAEFAVAALQAGMAYATLINKIVEISWERWENTESRKKEKQAKKEHHKKEEAKS